jgi:hypothetical protein
LSILIIVLSILYEIFLQKSSKFGILLPIFSQFLTRDSGTLSTCTCDARAYKLGWYQQLQAPINDRIRIVNSGFARILKHPMSLTFMGYILCAKVGHKVFITKSSSALQTGIHTTRHAHVIMTKDIGNEAL